MPAMNDTRHCMMRYFSNIAGYNGVFICSDYPHWIFLTGRGELRTHPMGIDGPVTSFAPFNNINCPQGFLYFNRKVSLIVSIFLLIFFIIIIIIVMFIFVYRLN